MSAGADSDQIHHFLATVLEKEGLMDKRRAVLMAAQFGSLKEFADTDFMAYAPGPSVENKLKLTRASREGISAAKAHIYPEGTLAENWVKFTSHNTTRKILQNIEELGLDQIAMNPFLIRLLNFQTPEELLQYNIYQTISRSIVTSMGTALEHMVADCGGRRGVRGEWYDMVKTDGKDQYWIQIKSGPNNVDKDQVVTMNEYFKKTASKPNQHPRLGIVYGKRKKNHLVMSMAGKYMEDHETRLLVGRELWEFISGKRNFHLIVLRWIENAVHQDLKDQSIDDKVQEAITRLVAEFKSKYGDGRDSIHAYIEDII